MIEVGGVHGGWRDSREKEWGCSAWGDSDTVEPEAGDLKRLKTGGW